MTVWQERAVRARRAMKRVRVGLGEGFMGRSLCDTW
jgi:hypothetical protein